MRPKLLKSFLLVVLFWTVATTMYWSVQQPEVNLKALQAVQHFFPFLHIAAPAKATITGSMFVQLKVLGYWSLPILALSVLSAIVGYGAVWFRAHKEHVQRIEREEGAGEYRGITVTKGQLPLPEILPKDEIEIGADDQSAFGRISEEERRLLADILGTASAAPQANPGGNYPSLLDHMLESASKAIEHKRYPGLSAIAAAAHLLGYITAYKRKDDGSWAEAKPHDREAARVLASLESWNALSEPERSAVQLAVKYHGNPKTMPEIGGDPATYRMARDLLTAVDEVKTAQVVEERQRVVENPETPDTVFNTFLQALPTLSFQSRGLPKGVAAVAWKVGSRVYMLEIKLREILQSKLSAEVRTALSAAPKERLRVQPFTAELLKALESQGWLVRNINSSTLPVKEALWNVKAGKLDFKGVIVVDVPAEYLSQLPSEDSMYEISVTGPLFQSAVQGASMELSKEDLLGSVLRASAPKAQTPASE